MRTIPLEVAYKSATPLPVSHHKTVILKVEGGGVTHIATTDPLVWRNDSSDESYELAMVNAALLAHAFNHLPKVVEAARNHLKFESKMTADDLRKALAAANQVEVP